MEVSLFSRSSSEEIPNLVLGATGCVGLLKKRMSIFNMVLSMFRDFYSFVIFTPLTPLESNSFAICTPLYMGGWVQRVWGDS